MPEAVAVPALAALTLTAFLAYIILFGLRVTVDNWAVGLLRLIGRHTPSIPYVGNLFLIAADAVEGTLGRLLGAAANACENSAVFYWHGLSWVIKTTIDDIHFLAHETWWGFHQLRHAVVPGLIHDATHPLSQIYRGIDQLIRHTARNLEHQISHGIDRVGRLEHSLERRILERLRATERAVAGELTRDLHRLLHGIAKPLRDALADLKARLRALEHHLTAAAIASAAVAAVAIEWPWLRCTNVKSLGRHLCRMPVQLLEELLSAAIDALTVVEICRIARLCQALAKDALPLIEELVLVENAVCLGGGESFPTAYEQPAKLSRATFASAI